MEHLQWLLLKMVEEFLRISKGGVTRNNLYDSTNHVYREIMATFSIKVCMIRFLKDRMSSITSDLYHDILKLNKSHTYCITQLVLCKTALIQLEKDLYRRIYKRERFVNTFCSN